MSILEDCQRFVLSDFNGTRPLVDPIDLPKGAALVAKNSRFSPGRVVTRAGFKPWQSLGANVYGFTPFYFSKSGVGDPEELIAFVRTDANTGVSDVAVIGMAAFGSPVSIFTIGTNVGAVEAIFSSSGNMLYAAIGQQLGAAVTLGAYVWTGSLLQQMIPCFQRPMKTTEVTEALTQPGAGTVTAGTHYVGVLFETIAGYWTKPGPADATTLELVPQSIISTGTNNIRVTLTPATTWPAWIKSVQVIMTTADNSFQYYLVPGTITTVTAGSATVYTIDVDISDLQLTSIGSQGAGTLADNYFSQLSMDASNVQPISTKGCVAWGQRMVWVGSFGGTDSIFPSDPLNFESISADQNILQLPGGKPIGSVFVMRGVLYAVSSSGGLYSWVDNSGKPVAFSPPTTIDERISVPGFYCTTVSASGGYAMIASPQGLYAFAGGSLDSLPISYLQQSIYGQIRWDEALTLPNETVQVIDFSAEKIIIVKALMGSASDLGIALVWDYNQGMTADKVNFSIWTCNTSSVNYGAFSIIQPSMLIAPVRKDHTALNRLWQLVIGSDGYFTRLQNIPAGDSGAALYTDNDSDGIDWQYQTAPLPNGDQDSPMLQHLACRFRATALTGTPALYLSAKSLDDVRTITLPISPITLSTAPGKEYLALYDSQEERVSILFTNNSVAGAGISLARLTHFYNFMTEER